MKREYYIQMRNQYIPKEFRAIFILESPPISGLYFYNKSGETSESLFTAMMKFLEFTTPDKNAKFPKLAGLQHFQECGYLLVDATYTPVNKESDSARNKIIRDHFCMLLKDLESINPDKSIPLILVKANVCKILDGLLREKGFNVLNQGIMIPFPSNGHQNCFQFILREVHRRL